MKKLVMFFFFVVFFFHISYGLECTPDGMITGVEVALDDNSFSSDFDGNSGVIYKLRYNATRNEYDLWLTNSLPYRTDKGNNIRDHKGLNPADILSDDSDLGKVLRINTSKFSKIYVKNTYKNTGSCEDYKYQSLKRWYSRVSNIGGSGRTLRSLFGGGSSPVLDVGEEENIIYSENIGNFYYGKLQISNFIRKKGVKNFHGYWTVLWLDGPSLSVPNWQRYGSFSHSPLKEGKNYSVMYNLSNPTSMNKLVNINLRCYTDRHPRHLSGYKHTSHFSKTYNLSPGENKIIQYNYTVPYEEEKVALDEVRIRESILYKDPIVGNFILRRGWPTVGSMNHSFLGGYIIRKTFSHGTTNEGLPYIGADYYLFEKNKYYSIGVPPDSWDFKTILYRKNSTSGWYKHHQNRSSFTRGLSENEKITKSFKYSIHNFEEWEGDDVKIGLREFWNKKNWLMYWDRTFSKRLNFMHLVISTDLPAYIYPKADREKVVRDIIFNLRDYKLRNVSFEVTALNKKTSFPSANFNINHPDGFDVPAEASYTVPIKMNYTGPLENERYLLAINYSYYDEIVNESRSKVFYGDVFIRSDSAYYSDLMPVTIQYDRLDFNRTENISVHVKNFGGDSISKNYNVSLYYRNVSENSFSLLDKKTVSGDENVLTYQFKPLETGKHIIKAEVDTDNVINETSIYMEDGELNNALSSIALVRDVDIVMEKVNCLYDNYSTEGVLPIKVSVSNNGIGGVNSFDLILNITSEEENWVLNKSFVNLPEEGRSYTFEWNVSNITPGVHKYSAVVNNEYDKNDFNNVVNGSLTFCPLPWGNSALGCFSGCTGSCVDRVTDRYSAVCDGFKGCEFYNNSFALRCDGVLEGSFVSFNSTHEASCPEASIKRKDFFTNNSISIKGDCSDIIVKERSVVFQSVQSTMNIIICKE